MENKFKKVKEENKAQVETTTPNVRENLYLKLTAPFPDTAYGADMTRSNVTLASLKAQYVVERLNQVFGLGMWLLTGEWKDVDDGILFVGQLTATFKDEDGNLVSITTGPVPGFAGTEHATSGDAYKSARTDCLSKAASLLGVGNELYKGNIEPRLSDEQKQLLEKRKGKQAAEEKSETEEEASSEEETEKPATKKTLKPARSILRGSRFKSREREKDGNANGATDSAS